MSALWQYKVLKTGTTGLMGGKLDGEAFETALNELGSEGWELSTSFDTNSGYGETRDVIAVFKRPLPT